MARAQEIAEQPVLLAHSQLRGVAGCHSQYLTNMGSQGTLTIAIVVRWAPRAASPPAQWGPRR